MDQLPKGATEADEAKYVDRVLAKYIRNRINDFNKQSKFIKIADFFLEVGQSKPTVSIPWYKFWKK